MKRCLPFILTLVWYIGLHAQPSLQHDLQFDTLAKSWDEAIPLGNGMIGALVWQKGDRLRFSLDRADLWDSRPMHGLHRKEFSYAWVHGQVIKKEYAIVQQYFDAPYNNEPAPSKIPGAALEIAMQNWGGVESVHLHLQNALCEVHWKNGVVLQTFVHAVQPVGWFRFEHLPAKAALELVAPKYEGTIDKSARGNVAGDDLILLGYKQGAVNKQPHSFNYVQQGWGGFSYQVQVSWKEISAGTIEGVWTISSHTPGVKPAPDAASVAAAALNQGYRQAYYTHAAWWNSFWSKSALHVPDSLVEKQWYLEQYKFGSAARQGAPPISLQAVWTADNGRLPPWKGDFHHDLNTQLSYWPCYSANHLEEGMSYLDHLDANKPRYKLYTQRYFKKGGLAVPGVTTLDGTEMGGWIQYSLSPTVVGWLSQHFYLQWRYSMDRTFLKDRAYPWLKDAAVFLEQITVKDAQGKRKLIMSSSPEIKDNSLQAWFMDDTNYDLALMKFTFEKAAELAMELGLKEDAAHWTTILHELHGFALSPNQELMFAPTLAYTESHRHFSHMMSIHPLGLIRWEDGDSARAIIKNSIALLDSIGPANWCGYSYAWLANMKARAKDGDGAVKDLQIFAKAFCSPNSFHLNGDQTGKGYSGFTYRPFTLEGNFAFAAGVQEMLLQSYAGFIEIMPAVPAAWNDVSFENLRAEGAFLISAKKINGTLKEVKLFAEKGGTAKLKLLFDGWKAASAQQVTVHNNGDGMITLECQPGSSIVLQNNIQ